MKTFCCSLIGKRHEDVIMAILAVLLAIVDTQMVPKGMPALHASETPPLASLENYGTNERRIGLKKTCPDAHHSPRKKCFAESLQNQ